MKYLSFVRSSEKYRDMQPPAAMMEAMGNYTSSQFSMVLGRRTYEIFAAHWPYIGDEDPIAVDRKAAAGIVGQAVAHRRPIRVARADVEERAPVQPTAAAWPRERRR